MKVYIITVTTEMTQFACFAESINGKDLYSLSVNDAKQFDRKIDAIVKAKLLDTDNIKHSVEEHVFED